VVLITFLFDACKSSDLEDRADAVREVGVTEIREVLRSWLAGAGLRRVAAQAGVDRKTARRYVEAAVAAGLARDGGAGQLTDELVGQTSTRPPAGTFSWPRTAPMTAVRGTPSKLASNSLWIP
jgi:hypothetical protein